MATEPVKLSACPPQDAASIRMGMVGNDMWAYWWCRNSTDVWAIWNTWLAVQLKEDILHGARAFDANTGKPYLRFYQWAGPMPMNAAGVPVGREHLWAAAYRVLSEDAAKPVAGVPNTIYALPELWVVTPNGSNPKRKSSKVINGVVQAYGSGTQEVKIGLPCDHTKLSYPQGSLTKYLPLYNNNLDFPEVISCIRIQ